MACSSMIYKVSKITCEADHSPLSTAEVRNVCSYTFTSPYATRMCWDVKHKDKSTFILVPCGKFPFGYSFHFPAIFFP